MSALPGPFDVVVSCSLLTQLQLVLLQVIGAVNLRFTELRTTLNRAHVRTLGALLAPAGVALLVTDLTDTNIYPALERVVAVRRPRQADERSHRGRRVIYVAHPGQLSSEMRRDPG